MKIKEMPVEERPREKLLKYGKENLTDAELLSLVLKTGTKDKSVLDFSYDFLNKINGIQSLKNSTYQDFVSIKGIGKAKAIELLAISELAKRINYKNSVKGDIYDNPKTIYENTKYLFFNLNQEYFYCLYLNSKKELIEKKLLFIGTLNKSIVHPREIFKYAYKNSASSIVCIHNHPSGDATPSVEDIELTKSLIEIGKLNGIPVIDHLIVTDNNYYSFYENVKGVLL